MAALGPITLTQGRLIFTGEDNIACSEKIAGDNSNQASVLRRQLLGPTGSVLTKTPALAGDRQSPKSAPTLVPIHSGCWRWEVVTFLKWKPPIAPHSEAWHLLWFLLNLCRLEAPQSRHHELPGRADVRVSARAELWKNLVQRLGWKPTGESSFLPDGHCSLYFLTRILLSRIPRPFFFFHR